MDQWFMVHGMYVHIQRVGEISYGDKRNYNEEGKKREN